MLAVGRKGLRDCFHVRTIIQVYTVICLPEYYIFVFYNMTEYMYTVLHTEYDGQSM